MSILEINSRKNLTKPYEIVKRNLNIAPTQSLIADLDKKSMKHQMFNRFKQNSVDNYGQNLNFVSNDTHIYP